MTAADMTKTALIMIQDKLDKYNYDAKIVNVVHDEILVECEVSIAPFIANIVENCMEQAGNIYCPGLKWKPEAKISTCWEK